MEYYLYKIFWYNHKDEPTLIIAKDLHDLFEDLKMQDDYETEIQSIECCDEPYYISQGIQKSFKCKG